MKIVIIGGMGPQASLSIHARLIQRAQELGATEGYDFPEIIHLSLPTKDFIGSEVSKELVAKQVLDAVSQVKIDVATKIVLGCNTAHLILDKLGDLNENIVSMVKITGNTIKAGEHTKVGLLASPVTIKNQLFEDACHGVEIITLDSNGQAKTEKIIRDTIAGKPMFAFLIRQIEQLIDQGAETVILGCTELSLIMHGRKSVNIVDPVDSLIDGLLNGSKLQTESFVRS